MTHAVGCILIRDHRRSASLAKAAPVSKMRLIICSILVHFVMSADGFIGASYIMLLVRVSIVHFILFILRNIYHIVNPEDGDGRFRCKLRRAEGWSA